jgi:antitoxin component YwqK of YwqJK toxin-antitoxin module
MLIVGLFFLISCTDECRVVKDTYKNKKEKEVFIYPNCDDTTFYLRQHFYENGQMSSEGHYKNGMKVGKFKSWSESGNQTADWEVLDGEEHGFIQCWYDNGIKKRELTLDRGIENGYFKEWDVEGKLKFEGNFLMGKKDRAWKYYEENGTWKIRNYRNDTLHGETFEYFVDTTSVRFVHGQYEKGKETGLWRWLDKDSILYQTALMSEREFTGEYIEYYKNSKVKSKGTLIKGEYEGDVFYYDEKGNTIKIENYRKGKLRSSRKKLSSRQHMVWHYWGLTNIA